MTEFRVAGHRLALGNSGGLVRSRPSPHSRPGLTQKYIVMHYTAGKKASGALAVMLRPNAYVSAHILIGSYGEVTQLVTFDRQAFHAGRSAWDGDKKLNAWSIGIELVNWGWLKWSDHAWRSWTGDPVPAARVIEAAHENGGAVLGWEKYGYEQIAAAVAVARALRAAYPIEDVLGHDQVATPKGRKQDPGPAFDMAGFRRDVFNRPVVLHPQT